MLSKLTNYLGEGYSIHTPLKLNEELLRYVQQAVLELGYQNNQLYIRDLIYGHNKGLICQELPRNSVGTPQELRRDSAGTPQELRKEPLDNQGVPTNQSFQQELLGTPTELAVKQNELPHLTDNSANELRQLKEDLDKSVNELRQLRDKSDKSEIELRQLKDKSDKSEIELRQLKDKSEVDISQIEITEELVPDGISAVQYRLYVRRLEDENVKLTGALKECYVALEGKQKQGDLSAMLYQSELGIHQIITWVWSNFQQFFPNQDLRQTLTMSVRNFYPSFPFFKLPNQ